MSRKWPLMYRKDGSLDLGQAICLTFTVFSCVSFWLSGSGYLTITPEAWTFLGACQVIVFLSWMQRERAEWLAKRGTSGATVAE